jgi:hypothetical protein
MPEKNISGERKPYRGAGKKNPKSQALYPGAIGFWDGVVSCHEMAQRAAGDVQYVFQAKDIKDGKKQPILTDYAWSRIRTGKKAVPKDKIEALIGVFKNCIDPAQLDQVYQQRRVINLGTWRPRVGVLEWPPFCSSGAEPGFLVETADRFFRLAGLQHIYAKKEFSELLSGAGVDMSLALAETIARTQKTFTFHTPGLMAINLVGRFGRPEFEYVRGVLTGKVTPDRLKPLRIMYIAGEVGGEFVKSLPKEFGIEHTELGARSENTNQKIERCLSRGLFYCADELTCLHALSPSRGLLFPIATPQVSRHSVYAHLPSYKIGMFTVPEDQEHIITFLKKALRVYLENSIEETALRYHKLFRKLVEGVTGCLYRMSPGAADFLVEAHTACADNVYTGVERIPVIAERWSRHVLRLYPEQTGHDLNLPWNDILVRARGLVGPIPGQIRTPNERRAAIMYRELPPVINASPRSSRDFSIFGSVLGTLRPHVELLEAKRYRRNEPNSHLGSDNPANVAVGFFAVPPRLFDWRFFRFPVKLKFCGAFISLAEGDERERQIEECLGLLRLLEAGHDAAPPRTVRILLLTFGAAHNLLRDHGLGTPLFRMVDDTEMDRGKAFLAEVDKEPTAPAIVVADELTCLEVVGANHGLRPIELLNHRLGRRLIATSDSGTGPYFSVAVRSSAVDWVRFFEQAIPLSLESYRESIAAGHVDLFRSLRMWARERVACVPDRPSDEEIDSWCRAILLLDRPDSLSPEWTSVLELAERMTKADAAASSAFSG